MYVHHLSGHVTAYGTKARKGYARGAVAVTVPAELIFASRHLLTGEDINAINDALSGES